MNQEPRNISLPQQQPTSAGSVQPNLVNCSEDVGAQVDPILAAQGWERRQLVDPERAQEFIELYESLGFEVLAKKLTPEDFAKACQEGASVVCQTYVLLHTRKKKKP